MMIATIDGLPRRRITRTLGLVTGNTVRVRHLGLAYGTAKIVQAEAVA